MKVEVLVALSCLTLCDPKDCIACQAPWNSPGKNTGVGCCFVLQGILLTQGSNLCLPHYRQILHHLNPKGSHIFHMYV